MATIKHPRGTRAAFDALVAGNALEPWQIYILTDEEVLLVATSANTYFQVWAGPRVSSGSTAPSSPAVGDIWVDPN